MKYLKYTNAKDIRRSIWVNVIMMSRMRENCTYRFV